jgi:hypothetical protein
MERDREPCADFGGRSAFAEARRAAKPSGPGLRAGVVPWFGKADGGVSQEPVEESLVQAVYLLALLLPPGVGVTRNELFRPKVREERRNGCRNDLELPRLKRST